MPSGPETANGAWFQSPDQKAGLGWARLCWASWRSLGRKFRSLVEVGTTAMAETAWVSWFTQVHSHLPGLLLVSTPAGSEDKQLISICGSAFCPELHILCHSP